MGNRGKYDKHAILSLAPDRRATQTTSKHEKSSPSPGNQNISRILFLYTPFNSKHATSPIITCPDHPATHKHYNSVLGYTFLL